jgi:hypothetical protein
MEISLVRVTILEIGPAKGELIDKTTPEILSS